jgi:uncharacterized protein
LRRQPVRTWLCTLLFVSLGSVCLSQTSVAQEIPSAPQDCVLDQAGVLTPAQRTTIRTTIVELERDTGAEFGVLIKGSCTPAQSADYATEVFNHWGIGKASENNGVLLTLLIDDRRVEITPGDGYQQLFTRSRSERLLKQHVVPHLKAGHRGAAVVAGVQEIADQIRMKERGISPAAVESHHAAPTLPVQQPLRPTHSPASSGSDALPVLGLLLFGLPAVIGLFLWLRPKCPQCEKALSVRRKVREPATYSSSGWGEKFLNCYPCGYSRTERYGIARRTRTDTTGVGSFGGFSGSGGSSFGGSGGSSFGGGSSSGGGGGASW